jgi:NAD(P)H-hydrate epimerase
MHVLTAAEMQACDRLTVEQYGIPSFELMRTAAAAVADFALQEFPDAKRVTVLCGRGNNGGDGMVAARFLTLAGLEVTTLLLGDPDGLKGDAARAWRELTNPESGVFHIVRSDEELAGHAALLKTDLLIDAVVGTGFTPPLKGLPAAAAAWVKDCKAPILAVDLPSGWRAGETSATPLGLVFPADAVITFTAPKPAHLLCPLTRQWFQPVVVAPIGSPPEAVSAALDPAMPRLHWAGSALAMAQAPRPAAANKGNFGHVLVVGGTFGTAGGKSGAPAMAALAALRAGAGLVTAAVPAPAMALVAARAPELMTWPLAATPSGCISAENLGVERVAALIAKKTVLAIGPGLGEAAETVKFATSLLGATKMPAIIDADALNMLAAKPLWLEKLGEIARQGRTLVMTPHPGEMARLARITVAEVQANRLEVARAFAQNVGVTLVLKGMRTLIAHPDGRVAVNTTGNPGMAKGGSGDVLAGLIAGLVAQHPEDPQSAVEAAVYLHGLAADLAVRRLNEKTLLATDVLADLSTAFCFRTRGQRGYVWLQGLPAKSQPEAVAEEVAV